MAHRSSVAVVQSINAPDFTNGENIDWLLKILRENDLEQFYDKIRFTLLISKYVFILVYTSFKCF